MSVGGNPTPRWGDIGDDQHEIELEPIEEPVELPQPVPAEPVRVPS